jgi:error-prone DNA polymerase
MPSDGSETTLARWRESGEWWSNEPYREYRRYIDANGVRRETGEVVLVALPDGAEPQLEDEECETDLRAPRREGFTSPHLVESSGASSYVCESSEPYLQSSSPTEKGTYRPPNQHPLSAESASDHQHRVGPQAVTLGNGALQNQSPEGACYPPMAQRTQERKGIAPRKVRDDKVARACGLLPGSQIRIVKSAPRLTQESYAALHVFSGYAFGRSAIHAEEIPIISAEIGISAVAIADPFSLAGAVEFARSAKTAGIKALIGATFEIEDGGEIVLIARNRQGYSNLSQLISACHLNEPRLYPLATWERLSAYTDGLLCLTGGHRGPLNRLLIGRNLAEAQTTLQRLTGLYQAPNVFVEIERSFVPWEISVNALLLDLAASEGVLPVAGGLITHEQPKDFPAQDVLVCIDTLCTVDEIVGRKPQRLPEQKQTPVVPERAFNHERYLRGAREFNELFIDRQDLVRNTLKVAERCDDDVLPARTVLPQLYPDDAQALQEIVQAGAHLRYPTICPKLKKRIDHEIERIIRLGFATHFLVAWDMCRWAEEQDILFSGRGSVVDSAVAFCLGLSRIDAFQHNLHFDRFLPNDGSKRPDIDIDFEANRRNDIRGYLSSKYGDDKVATIAAFGAYCTKGIIRGVGKVLGIDDQTLGFLCKHLHGGITADRLERALEKRPELRESHIPKERLRWVFRLAEELMDLPTNIRSHSSGVIISSRPIAETVPLLQSAVDGIKITQWDKRTTKHYFDKFDILCLRGHDVLAGTQKFARETNPDFSANAVPIDDEESFRTMRSGQLIGIPQSASPAMRQAHVRLQTQNLHDASLVQAGIRPGVGGAVKLNELIARKRGLCTYTFEHPAFEEILGITYGIIVFQEQVDQLLQTICGYTSGEAEDIRDAIHKKRREGYASAVYDDMIQRATTRGFGLDIANKTYEYVSGFQGYGFAQGHALAFAEISIRSIYCQQNLPAEYFAALLNAQPAGYYGPCTIANEARVRGVAVLPPDVNFSELDFSVEDVRSKMDPRLVIPRGGIRVGFRQMGTLSKPTRERIVSERHTGLYDSIFDFCARVHPNRDELEALILCGAFDRVNDNRRQLLWVVQQAVDWGTASLHDVDTLDLKMPEPELPEVEDFTLAEKAIYERCVLGMDVERHLVAFERKRVLAKGGMTAAEVVTRPTGTRAFAVGTPMRLRFPPTRTGKRVVFFDLEDESGILNVTCFDDTYQRYGHAIVCSQYLTVVGQVQNRDGYMAFLADHVYPYHPVLDSEIVGPSPLQLGVADFLAR